MSAASEFSKGFWRMNPVLRGLLGLCPTLAVTTSVNNAIGMGVSVIFVLTASNIVISLLRKVIPSQVRIPCFIIIIATFVTMTDLLLKGFAYDLHKSLGIFIPLIVVNCIILGRAEAFASRNTVGHSIPDGLGMGIGFTLALIVLASLREVLGNGTFYGVRLFGEGYQKFLVMILPPGAFMGLGFLLAGMNALEIRRERCRAGAER